MGKGTTSVMENSRTLNAGDKIAHYTQTNHNITFHEPENICTALQNVTTLSVRVKRRVPPEVHSLWRLLRPRWVWCWRLCRRTCWFSLWWPGFSSHLRLSPLHRCRPGSALPQNTHNALNGLHSIQTMHLDKFNHIWGTYLIVQAPSSVASPLSSDTEHSFLQNGPCGLQMKKKHL